MHSGDVRQLAYVEARRLLRRSLDTLLWQIDFYQTCIRDGLQSPTTDDHDTKHVHSNV